MRSHFAFFWFAMAALGSHRGAVAELDVYILTGQSNSLGTTNLEGDTPATYGPGEHPFDATTEFWWSNVDAANSGYPPQLYGDSNGMSTPLQMQQGGTGNPAFWGPEFGLGRSLFANAQFEGNSAQRVLVIKASRGGGGNTLWDQAAFDASPSSGHMWGHLRDTVDAALDSVDATGTSFTVKGLFYLQGESNNASEANLAADRLATLIDNLAEHIDASYPGTTADLRTVVGEIAASQSNGNRQTTTQQHQDLASANANIAFVPTADLPLKSDGIHFGRDAKLTIGARFGTAYLDLLQLPNGVPGDVNQDGMLSGDGTGPIGSDDVSAFLAHWRSDTSLLSQFNRVRSGDLDLSGRTDLADAYRMHQALTNVGSAFPFGRLVPEPTSAWSLGLGGLIWGWGFLRRAR